MRLIVDTSRIIAALIRDSTSRTILYSQEFEFLTVNFAKSEIAEHKLEIIEKSRMKESELDQALSMLFSHIQIISDLVIESRIPEARDVMDSVDPDDTLFIAAALAVENNGIWSDDLHFQRQKKIRIFKTSHLIEMM